MLLPPQPAAMGSKTSLAVLAAELEVAEVAQADTAGNRPVAARAAVAEALAGPHRPADRAEHRQPHKVSTLVTMRCAKSFRDDWVEGNDDRPGSNWDLGLVHRAGALSLPVSYSVQFDRSASFDFAVALAIYEGDPSIRCAARRLPSMSHPKRTGRCKGRYCKSPLNR